MLKIVLEMRSDQNSVKPPFVMLEMFRINFRISSRNVHFKELQVTYLPFFFFPVQHTVQTVSQVVIHRPHIMETKALNLKW